MFFSRSAKHKMLLGIVGPSISCGIFLGMAINYVEKNNAFSVVLMLLMSAITLYITLESYKKVSKLLP